MLKQAIDYLSSRCDGADSLDGAGFNKMDTQFGHDLAATPFADWTPRQRRAAWRMLRKYRGQLEAAGIDYDEIDEPQIDQEERWLIVLRDNNFVISTPYDPDLVKEIQDIPGRNFDGDTKTWRVPAGKARSVIALAAFVAGHEFELDDEAAAILAAADDLEPEPDKVLRLAGDRFIFEFDYAPAISNAIKNIAGYQFERRPAPHWSVPVEAASAEAALAIAESYGFHVAGGVTEAAQQAVAAVAAAIEASRAGDAEIQVAGLGGTLRPFQRAGVAYALGAKRTFIADEMGLGKAQPLTAKILTPTRWTTMGEIQVGDRIVGRDGKPCNVIGVYPQGKKKIYRVTFSDGTFTECCDEHLWLVNSPLRKWRGTPARVMSLQEIIDCGLKHVNGNRQHFIPLVKPVEFEENPLPLDPYLIGVLLGDGGLNNSTPILSTADEEILSKVSKLLPEGVSANYSEKYDYYLSAGRARADDNSGFAKNPLTVALRELNMMGKLAHEKEIPEVYKFSSAGSRLKLLRGLMDTDGWVNKGERGNSTQFCSCSEQLAKDVMFLAQSLGGTAKIKFKNNSGQGAYIVTLSMPNEFNPFTLTRKADLVTCRTKYNPSRSIASIELVGIKEAQCIAVDSPDHLYVTDNFIVTHNTIQALATVQAAEAYPALIVCPASLKLNWQREATKWLPGRSVGVISGTKGDFEAEVVIINYDILGRNKKKLLACGFQSVTLDESHYIKNHKAQRTKHAQEIGKEVGIRLCLTGTPVVNRPQELIAQLDFLDRLDDLGGFWPFAKRYCDAHQEKVARKKVVWNLDGASNLDELNEKLRAACYIRRNKADVLAELPAKQRSVVPVEIDNRQEYDAIYKEIIDWIEECRKEDAAFEAHVQTLPLQARAQAREERGMSAEARAHNAEQLVLIERLKQKAAEGKMGAVIEWVESFLESGEKLVLFAHHQEIIDQLAHHFKARTITGQTPISARQSAVDDFQEDPETNLIILNIRAGGVGLTLTAASNVAFCELEWTPAAHDQAEDRCHRIGQQSSVNAWYLLGQETIDDEIYALIEAKRQVVDAATEGGDVADLSVFNELWERLGGQGEMSVAALIEAEPEPTPEPAPIPEGVVRRDPADLYFIQSRAEVYFSTIDEYAEMMRDGTEFDPAFGLIDNEGNIYVWDGYHRGEAARQTGQLLRLTLKRGTKEDAEWLALTANQKHGLRRSRKDKQRIVRNALEHPKGVNLSDREIARHTGVDHKTVGRVRRELEASGEIPQMETRTVTRGGQTYEIDTANIGRQEPEPATPAPQAAAIEGQNIEPEPGPSSEQAEFDCPRCGRERIVRTNGGAWCLACDARWEAVADFHAEQATGPEMAAQPSERRRLRERRRVLREEFSGILSRLGEYQLDEAEAWLIDFKARIFGA